MGFTCGIVGLPNVGKSTLFNALTAAQVDAANYPFCTIEPNTGIVPVPDRRLTTLARILRPPTTVPTTIGFKDIAGLVRGASRGEGLGNQFLAHIREVDAIVHVVRCFNDPNVVHVDGTVDPLRDIEVVETELLLKDLETTERRGEEAERKGKAGEARFRGEATFLSRLRNHLSSGRRARSFATEHEEERLWLRDLHLLTNKPVLYVCNIDEEAITGESDAVNAVRTVAAPEGARVVPVCAEIEAELVRLSPEERNAFLRDLGLQEGGLDRLIREGYDLLHLVTFFTANAKELRAWTVQRGTPAPRAAGTIHSDFERGFIRAEVMKFADLERLHSEQAVRDAGLLHTEGKSYAIEDGDVILFRFNV